MFPRGNGAPPMRPYLPPPPTADIGLFGPRPLRPPPPPYAAVPYHHYDGGAVFRHYPVPAMLQSVTAVNFSAELDMIGALLPSYPYVVVDTEYPGTVHHPPAGTRLTADDRYALVKANVDELPIVQLGLTLCDAQGNLPVVFFDCNVGYPVPMERAWEINFSDFDVHRDRHAAQSVDFLRSQGIDFDRARACGVSSAAFKDKLVEVLARARAAQRGDDGLTWVTFGGAYDLAYLVKMLSDGQPLPDTRQEFMDRVRVLLGGRVFDAKYMAENCGRADLRGVGLRTVAANLGMPRPIVEHSFLAGHKSLIACRIHTIMRTHVLSKEDVAACEGIIDGLQ